MKSRLVSIILFIITLCSPCFGESNEPIKIKGFPPNPEMAEIIGNGWWIYINGSITSSTAQEVDQYLTKNHVPAMSMVVLNSPGGSLIGGMELGRVLRKHGMKTDVGVQLYENKIGSDGGYCMSACTLAYVGGVYRYLNKASHYGVHRFAFSQPQEGGVDSAQIASALIVSYLREMEIDPELFNLSTMAANKDIYEPERDVLERLKIVNNGNNEPKWTVESADGYLYLKGVRDNIHGTQKFIVYCSQGQPYLSIFFDPQGRNRELMSFPAHTLMIDHIEYPIEFISRNIPQMTASSGTPLFNSDYLLTAEHIKHLTNAEEVGVIIRMSYEAPIFFGFQDMPFKDGANKLIGIMNTCSETKKK
jgi:hypothetical protein